MFIKKKKYILNINSPYKNCSWKYPITGWKYYIGNIKINFSIKEQNILNECWYMYNESNWEDKKFKGIWKIGMYIINFEEWYLINPKGIKFIIV